MVSRTCLLPRPDGVSKRMTETETKTRAGALGRFLGYVKVRRVPTGNALHLTAAQVNARPLVGPALHSNNPNYNGPQGGNGPQFAPDQIRQSLFDGIGHIGVARVPKFVSTYDQTAWESQNFLTSNVEMRAGASIVGGRQTQDWNRANIDVPVSVPYGSQFSYQPIPYGYV